MSQTPTTHDGHRALRTAVVRKRRFIEVYLSSTMSRRALLLNVALVAGALAAALTAAPALGGKPLADWLTSTLGLSSPAWQLTCGLAAACSLAATIATQLMKSHNLEEHIAQAQAARARLEALEISIASSQISDTDAAAELIKCIEEAAFIEPSPRRPAGA